MKLRIFTDGACSGNPGPGGWAAVILGKDKNGDTVEIGRETGYELETTNNRMELLSIVEALRGVYSHLMYEGWNTKKSRAKKVTIEVVSDSSYVVEAVNKNWITVWSINGWKTKQKTDVKNKDLWLRLMNEMETLKIEYRAKIVFVKVKGHSGDEYNELCDKLARQGTNKAKKILPR